MSKEEATPGALEQAMADILNKAMDGVDNATIFLQAELPEVVEQLLYWMFAKNFVIGALFIGLVWFIWSRMDGYCVNNDWIRKMK